MAAAMDVFEELILHVTLEKFFIESVGHSRELLVIDRVSRDIGLQSHKGQIPAAASSKSIYGIIGIVQLLAGPYLIVITKRSKVGQVNGQDIWKIEATEMISYARTLLHLNEAQLADNRTYIQMIQEVLNTPYFYFSYSYDLSHTLQRLHNTMPDFLQMPLYERADERFVWNRHLIRDFVSQPELSRFILPIIHGFVTSRNCSLNGNPFVYTLISRRSCYRAGTRFYMRGVDPEGEVANFVETEQIIEYLGDKSSFVQTRGSIPIFWTQLPNIRYKPNPSVTVGANHLEGLSKHFDTQVLNYGKQVIINLIDQKGAEGDLERAFSNVVSSFKSPFVKYEAFDFHHECRKMRWDRLSILMDRISGELEEFGFFMLLRDGSVARQQDGAFRTNCIDCLDRTNVVQSLLARRVLQEILVKLGLLNEGQRVEHQTQLERTFKEIWADHADVISIQYSGTGALKTDFTRTGKRTKAGVLRDGINSAVRYYKNNFADGFRQDAIDLFVGNYVVIETEGLTEPSPLKRKRDMRFSLLPLVSLFALAMWSYNVILPAEYTTAGLMYILFWGCVFGASLGTIVYNGPEFVDWPKLVARYKLIPRKDKN